MKLIKSNGLLIASEYKIRLEQAFKLYEANPKYIAVGHNGKFEIRKED
jgi:hypothetical protein